VPHGLLPGTGVAERVSVREAVLVRVLVLVREAVLVRVLVRMLVFVAVGVAVAAGAQPEPTRVGSDIDNNTKQLPRLPFKDSLEGEDPISLIPQQYTIPALVNPQL